MAVLRSGFMPDDLVAHEAFTDRVADLVAIIVRSGIRAAVQDAVQAVGHRRVS
jgi:fructuronate reductase